jgi:hypothetical protein
MKYDRSRLNQPYLFPGISCGLRGTATAGVASLPGSTSTDEDEFTSCTIPF